MKSLTGVIAAMGMVLALPVTAADESAIEERVRSLVPEIETLSIAETPVPGMMEVQLNNEILYMSEDGRYLVQGRMIDLETQTDLTDSAKAVLRREKLADLDESQMVSFGPEDAEYELMVFTDTDCGYCRRLHEQIDEYIDEGIRINYLAFPRAGAGSETFDTMVSVWCADDRQSAMNTAKAGQQPPQAKCDNPVEEHYRLGKSLGVTGTPSMMTANGDMIPGYVPPQQLRQRLEGLGNGQASAE
ncbi:DsbC family protein [Wenzhouxiangella sp. EGI_FJ10409]|uniref:DsbC family protein n=1 Tax=Wenzhouxiangella sp. EGI_FJ10409 TaxID=3243767 RepID=UPI0035DDD9F0